MLLIELTVLHWHIINVSLLGGQLASVESLLEDVREMISEGQI